MLTLVSVPLIVVTVCPVRTVGIDIFAADDVQLVGFKVVGCVYLDSRAVHLGHRGLQFYNAGSFGHYLTGTKATKGNPAHSVVIDGHTRVKIGIGTLRVCTWRVVMNHQFLVRRLKRTNRRIGLQYANAVTRVTEV